MFALVACSEAPVIVVFNDSGSAVTLMAKGELFGLRGLYTLEPGQHVRVPRGAMLKPSVRILARECEIGYEYPAAALTPGNPLLHSPLNIQIEPDYSAHLLPTDASGITSIASIKAFEDRFGFPIKPLFKRCR